MTLKTCTCCLQDKPLHAFHQRIDRPTIQHYSRCKECRKRSKRLRTAMGSQSQGTRLYPSTALKENNAFNLWHGPVSRDQPLRWAA